MSIRTLNGKQYYCLPVVGGIFGLIWMMGRVLLASDIDKEQQTLYRVTREDRYGNREESLEYGSGIGGLVVIIAGIAGIFWTAGEFIEAILETVDASILLLLPIFSIGLFSYFYRERLDEFYTKRLSESTFCNPLCVVAILCSFFVASYVGGALSGDGRVILLYVPFVILIFLAFLGPLFVSLILAKRFYASTYRSRGKKGVILTRMSLVILFSIAASIYGYVELSDISSFEGFKSTLLTALSSFINLFDLSPYATFLASTTAFMLLPLVISLKLIQLVAQHEGDGYPDWLLSKGILLTIMAFPIMLCGVVWAFPAFTGFFTPEFVESAVRSARFKSPDIRGLLYDSFVVEVGVISSAMYLYFRLYLSRANHYDEDLTDDIEYSQLKRWAFITHLIFAGFAAGVIWSIE